ncbi:hypothetical protein [Arenimonas composti]|uniref:Lipoprotein n=1 Tax=Arenimonas composti TR7-09 = DSM 18010 TaxID=1121013 RepID=A0A091BDE0_9GAMM|nr:hypothetical protein [Arenimonas composti]KFN49522.1 hypothetical protein P873_10235 [Arenimonas composti TR7-09 = DSM 18010]
MRTLVVVLPLLLAAGCASSPRTHQVVEIPVSCAGTATAVDCLRTASELCGERGYTLHDADGREVTLADLRHRPGVARCRR